MRVSKRDAPIATYRRGFLIYNPNAGQLRRGHERRLKAVLRILGDAGHRIEPLPTTGPGAASALAASCVAQGADVILVAGGDGTINEAANGMAHSGVPLGLLPAGTANVLAVEAGIPRSMERAAALVRDATAEPVAAGILRNETYPTGRYFLLMAGAGLDAGILEGLRPSWKASLGKAAYWLAGFAQVGRPLPEFDVAAGAVSGRFSFALLSRVRNYGGDIQIARDIGLLDNRFEIVLFRGSNAFVYLGYLAAILAGRLKRARGVVVLHGSSARLDAPPGKRAFIQVDGESAGALPASVELAPGAITLLLPPAYSMRFASRAAASWTPSPTR